MGHVKIITLIDFHGIIYYEIIIVREKIDFKNQKQSPAYLALYHL